MLSFGTNIRYDLEKGLKKFASEAALVFAGQVSRAFRELLYDSPQRYGSYVASWRMSAGRAESGGFEQWPYREPDQWYAAGATPAIGHALAASSGLTAGLPSYLSTTSAIFPIITVYNDTPYASSVESGPLREENQGHEMAFAKFKENLFDLLHTPVEEGSPQWLSYMDNIL
jgi:hypothetical protein